MALNLIDESDTQSYARPSAREEHGRSFLKAVSWRLTGTLATFVIGIIVTGKPSIAGSIAATEFFTKIALYYGHERLWAAIRWGLH